MAPTGQMFLHVLVVDEPPASAATLALGAVDIPFDRADSGSLDLAARPAEVADMLRRAADRLDARRA